MIIQNQPLVSEQVYTLLRQRIISGHFMPGERVIERRVADELGVSRVPVREAVRRLLTEGLVVLRPRVGPEIVVFNAVEIRHLYHVRLALELAAAELIIGQDPATVVDELDPWIIELDALARVPDPATFLARDLDLHERIVASSGNPLLLSHYRMINAQVHVAIAQRWFREAGEPNLIQLTEEHRRLLDAIRHGDRPRTERLLRTQILGALETLRTG